MDKDHLDYPISFIRLCLENYGLLSEGRWFESDGEGRQTRAPSYRAPFEAASIVKADLDLAIEQLPHEEKDAIRICYLIPQEDWPRNYNLEAHKYDVNKGIRDMASFLNACVLREWCKVNGLMTQSRHVPVLDSLPEPINDYVKRICLDYCTLERCIHG